MLSVLLDTHILLWWRSDAGGLTPTQRRTLQELERKGSPVAISAITLWELANLVACGRRRITVPLDAWLEELENHPLIAVLPLTARVVADSVQLGADFHKDPADRIIVATARCHGLRLMTADQRIRRWGRVPLI
jgi:PIN domain nuclease of toxin-antitoxin system